MQGVARLILPARFAPSSLDIASNAMVRMKLPESPGFDLIVEPMRLNPQSREPSRLSRRIPPEANSSGESSHPKPMS
jgi:hypothetical protein